MKEKSINEIIDIDLIVENIMEVRHNRDEVLKILDKMNFDVLHCDINAKDERIKDNINNTFTATADRSFRKAESYKTIEDPNFNRNINQYSYRENSPKSIHSRSHSPYSKETFNQ